MEQYSVQKIGDIRTDGEGFRVALYPEYRAALEGLEGFSHLQVLWWFSGCDDVAARSTRQEASPYKCGPAVLGTFATRSPLRPNPIALSTVQPTWVDKENAVIGLAYIDAEDGSPVLDIKPYTPSLDRAEKSDVPAWCSHWPSSIEESGVFNWEAEFDF